MISGGCWFGVGLFVCVGFRLRCCWLNEVVVYSGWFVWVCVLLFDLD